MTIMIEPDTRGIDALSGETPDNVPELPLLIWEGLTADLGPIPEAPFLPSELEFDEQPWQLLPTLQDLEQLWLVSPLVDIMIHRLALKAHGDGEDLPRYIYEQWQLADLELKLKKEREAQDVQSGEDYRAAKDGPVGAVAPVGGGQDLSGQPQNGDQVEQGRKVAVDPNSGRPPKVPRKRGAAKTAGRVEPSK